MTQRPKIRRGQFARINRRDDAKVIDNDDVGSTWVPMRKGADAEPALVDLHTKIEELIPRRFCCAAMSASGMHYPSRKANSNSNRRSAAAPAQRLCRIL